jgi:hypothetical protein
VTFLQLFSYAFGPSTKFSKGLEKPVEFSRKIAILDFHFAINIDPAQFFIPEIKVVFLIKAVFLLIVLSKMPEKLTNLVNTIMRSKMYGEEAKAQHAKEAEEQNRCNTCWLAHICASTISLIRSAVGLFIMLNSTVLVVPISKKLAQLVDCEHPEDAPPYLSADPNLMCWGSQHLFLVRIMAVLWPLYILALIPHVLVSGDPNYMKRAEMLNVLCWGRQAKRKATVLYIGILHPKAESLVYTKLVEFFTKMALPCVVILTTHAPLMQTCALAACGLIGVLCSIAFPPLVEKSWNAIERSLQLFTFLSMCCGILSVLFPEAHVADYSLIAAFVACINFTYCQIQSAGHSQDEEDQQSKQSSGP